MEIGPFGGIEIGVANITAANNHSASIGNPRLVVHAPVDASEPEDKFQASIQDVFPRPGWVEEPQLDIGMAVDGVEDAVGHRDAEIVQKQPHAHAAICCGNDLAHHQPTGQVGIPHVIHQIKAAPRRPRRRHAHCKGIQIGMQQAERVFLVPAVPYRLPVAVEPGRILGNGQGS